MMPFMMQSNELIVDTKEHHDAPGLVAKLRGFQSEI